jgi:multisubunit Na+/H+ antiporter MnhG subunit
MSIIADIVACVPSLYKTVRLPHTESLAFYALDVVAGACIVLASSHTFAALLYPLYIMLINAVFVAIIWRAAYRPQLAPDEPA